MKKKALIEMYEKELQDIFSAHKVMKTSSISEVKDRTEAEAIQRFIHNLKNFDNDVLLGVSFSLDFVKWYSGMDKQHLLNALEKYKRESDNDS